MLSAPTASVPWLANATVVVWLLPFVTVSSPPAAFVATRRNPSAPGPSVIAAAGPSRTTVAAFVTTSAPANLSVAETS